MKFKIYNAENSPHTKVTPGYHEAHVTICHNGNVVLNSHLLKLMKNPDRVIIAEDEEYRGDFYIAASKDPHAFALSSPDKRGARYFSSSTMSERFEESLKVKAPFIIAVSEAGRQTEIGMTFPLMVKKVRCIERATSNKQ